MRTRNTIHVLSLLIFVFAIAGGLAASRLKVASPADLGSAAKHLGNLKAHLIDPAHPEVFGISANGRTGLRSASLLTPLGYLKGKLSASRISSWRAEAHTGPSRARQARLQVL